MMMVPAASPLLAVGAPQSFLQLIQLLLRPLSNSRFLSHQPMFFAIAPDMLPCEISIQHSRCIQVSLQSSTSFQSSDAYAHVQMNLGPGASQSLTSKFLPRRSKENSRAFSNSLIKNCSSGVTRCNDFAFWTPFSVRAIHSSVFGASPSQFPLPHLRFRFPVGTAVCSHITLSSNRN